MNLAIQFGVSLFAVLTLAWLVKFLKLGGEARLRDVDHARQIASESVYGFRAVDVALDRAGYGALVKDARSRHMLIRAQGINFVTRMISPQTNARLDQNFLTLDVAEPDFAPVTLNLGEAAQYWASGLRHIPHD
jgi:hypothetical protein